MRMRVNLVGKRTSTRDASNIAVGLAMIGIVLAIAGWGIINAIENNACDGVFRPWAGRCATGTVSVTIPAGSSTAGGVTVPFGTTFTNVPNSFEFRYPSGFPTQTVTVGTETSFKQTWFQSGTDAGETWTSMPAVATEIYNDGATTGAHRIIVDWATATTFELCATVIVASTSATAYLSIYYSTDNGGTFTELNSQQRFNTQTGDLPINACANFNSFSTIPLAAQINNLVLAVYGANGNGVGDNPKFSTITVRYTDVLSLTATVSVVYNVQSCRTSLSCGVTNEAGTTSMFLRVATTFKLANTITVSINWRVQNNAG